LELRVSRQYGAPALEENQGAVTEEEAAFLYGLALALRPTCIAEVGTGWLRSLRAFCGAAAWLRNHLDWPCAVWSCDIKKDAVTRAQKELPLAHVVCGDSIALAKAMCPAPQLIFIDGEHHEERPRKDYEALKAVADEKAVFVFHDTGIILSVREYAEGLGAICLPTPRGMGILA